MTAVAVFTIFELFTPHLIMAKVMLVDVKENYFITADEGGGKDSTDHMDYGKSLHVGWIGMDQTD